MADTTLSLQSDSLGLYNGQSLSLTSPLISVLMVDGLAMTMNADQEVWADGYLTLTVVVENISGAYAYTAPLITSVLDPTLVALVDGTVTLDDTPLLEDTDYTFDPLTGTLEVTFGDIAIAGSSTLTFQVEKV